MSEKKVKWFTGVSFKTEVMTEYACQKGLKHMPNILGKDFFLTRRRIIDNDIFCDEDQYEHVKNQILKDYKKIIPDFFNKVLNTNQEYIDFASKLPSEQELEKLSNKELIKVFEEYYAFYEKCVGIIAVPVFCEIALMDVINKKLKKYFKDEKDKQEFLLAASYSEKKTATYQEKIDLLNLALKIKDKKNIKQYEKDVLEHEKKYDWIHETLFLGERYDKDKIINQINKFIDENPSKKLEELKQIEEKENQSFEKAIDNIDKDFLEDIKLLQELVYFRNYRLEQMNLGCHKGRPLLREITKRLKLTYNELIYLYPTEIIESLEKGLTVSKKEINERIKKYALVTIDGETKLYTGKQVDELLEKEEEENIDEVKGIVASKGKATGTARIVKDRSELHKVNKGDILITKLTTPDFVVAMEKSAAIVTDMGGLTSHAAIVSRELGIPCVTGTKIATKVFKDGDTIEVNAEKGLVKRLKSTKSL